MFTNVGGVTADAARCALFLLLVRHIYHLCAFHIAVCDIYENHKYVLCILFVFAGAQCAAMAISARMVVPGQRSSATCLLVASHPGLIHVG
jgi:hypothetical protein